MNRFKLVSRALFANMAIAAFLTAQASAADLYVADDFHAPVSDQTARQVGDILTVMIYENSSASNTADTSTNTNFGVQAKVSAIGARTNAADVGLGDSYSGRGKIQRTGRLLAQVSATVSEVLPSGDMRIVGDQQINVNGEKTSIHLTGRVRPIDIGPSNTVISGRLADARIDYVGDGFVTDRSRPGLIPRFFGWLGLW